MSNPTRQRIAVLLLAVYVPLSLLVGHLHTDEVTPSGSGTVSLQQLVVKGVVSSENSGFCLACIFAAGQLVQSQTLVTGLPFRHIPVFDPVLANFGPAPQPQSARGPPVPSFS
jgi:hypothetical protein